MPVGNCISINTIYSTNMRVLYKIKYKGLFENDFQINPCLFFNGMVYLRMERDRKRFSDL